MGTEEILWVAWSGSFDKERLFLLVKGEKCMVLKRGNMMEIAEYIANNYPISCENPEIKTDLCDDCPIPHCHKKYVALSYSELQKLIDLIFHIQEGDKELIEDAYGEDSF